MHQYAVIANLDPPGPAAYTMASLPLHVTLLSIYSSAEPPSFFTRLLHESAGRQEQLKVKTTGRALFGINQDIPVTLIERTEPLHRLHLSLLGAVQAHVSFRAPQFTGEGFGPHVTDQGDQHLEPGQTLVIDNLTLVEIVDDDVRVQSILPLREQ